MFCLKPGIPLHPIQFLDEGLHRRLPAEASRRPPPLCVPPPYFRLSNARASRPRETGCRGLIHAGWGEHPTPFLVLGARLRHVLRLLRTIRLFMGIATVCHPSFCRHRLWALRHPYPLCCLVITCCPSFSFSFGSCLANSSFF